MRAVAVLGVALLLASCASSDPPREGRPELNRGTALIETDGPSALLYVVVAETEEQRAVAFAETTSLEDDEGLAFLYFQPTSAPFETESRFPLSVAFFDLDGEVLEVVDMEPCAPDAQTCPAYDPDGEYLGALSVNEGLFDRLRVDDGATIEIIPGSE